MKRIFKILVATMCVALIGVTGAVALSACNSGAEKDILVIAREDGSGTKDAFDSLVKDADGNKLKDTTMVSSVEQLSKTGNVITKVSVVKSAIGYISLGSLNDTVKALTVGGVEPTAANVINDTYKFWRPFVIMTNKTATEAGTLSAATQDFIKYLSSTAAQSVVDDSYVTLPEVTAQYTAPASALSGKILLRGSTSVEPLMGKLIQNYQSLGGAKVSAIEFDMQCEGSSYGVSAVKADGASNVIGLSSLAVKSGDEATISHFDLAKDAVAIIVNKSNSITNITSEQLYAIYTGAVTKFSTLA